jgi:hypothetical protein
MNKNAKRFPIHVIASLGCKSCEFVRDGENRDEAQMEVVSFMLWNARVSKFGLEHMRASVRDEIIRQFPSIDFQVIEARSRAIFGSSYNPKSRKYKVFLKSLEDSYGKTRIIRKVGDDFVYPPPHFYTTGGVPASYVCSICNVTKVKLWRPYMGTQPLICAKCAEERQSLHEYNVIDHWVPGKHSNGYDCWVGIYKYELSPSLGYIIKKELMKKWTVDDNGKVPSYLGSPSPGGIWLPTTDQLSVDLSKLFKSCSSGDTSMVPAIPDNGGEYWGYTSVPEEGCLWWQKLPTHQQLLDM